MPIRSTVFDEAVRSAWRRVAHLWRPMAGWTLLVWVTLALALVPLSSAVIGRYVFGGDRLVVGNEELIAWLLSPLGLAWALLAGGLSLMAGVVRFAGIFCIVTDDMEGRPPSVRRTALELAPVVPRLFRLCVKSVAAAAILAAPLLAGLGAVYALLLRHHDINYYLATRPPEWRVALAAGAVWTVAWAVPAVWVASRGILALPAYLDGYQPLRAALRRAWDRTRGSAGRLIRLLVFAVGVWLGIRLAVQALYVTAAAASIGWVAHVSPSLRPILLTTGLFAAGSIVVDAVIAFFGFAFVATVVTKFYLEDTDLHQTAPAPPCLVELRGRAAAALQGWLRPARLLPAALLFFAVSLIGATLLLEPLPEPRRVVIHAHRAGPPPAPENTLAALELAIAAGADYSEIDVQRTRDGVVVVLHDADFMRVAGDPRRVAGVAYADIAGLVQLPDDGSPAAERRVATLGEFLDRARGRIRLNIELKYYGWDPELAGQVVREVRRRGMAGEVVIMSLSLGAVRQVRELAPDIRTGYVSAVAVGDVSRLPVDFIAIAHQRAVPRLIRAARARDVDVYPWTVNRADVMGALMDRGVAGIITDDPALAVRVRDELAALSPPSRLLLRFRGFFLDEARDRGPPATAR